MTLLSRHPDDHADDVVQARADRAIDGRVPERLGHVEAGGDLAGRPERSLAPLPPVPALYAVALGEVELAAAGGTKCLG